MKLGKFKIIFETFIFFTFSASIVFAADKIESVPLINLEELSPVGESQKREAWNQVLQIMTNESLLALLMQSDVLLRCRKAEPRHGELWCKYSKNIKHWKQKTESFLLMAAKELELPT